MRSIVAVIRSSPLAGLCYDTPSVEVVLFPVDTPDKTPMPCRKIFIRKNFRLNPL